MKSVIIAGLNLIAAGWCLPEFLRAKWTPVRVKKMRRIKDIGSFRGSTKTAMTPVVALIVIAVFGPVTAVAGETGDWLSEAFAKQKPQAVAAKRNRPASSQRARLGGPSSAEKQVPAKMRSASLSGGDITWQASSGCLSGRLRGVIGDLIADFGPVTVTSTCRSASQNRSTGGADQSYHLRGEAVDFRTRAGTGAVYAFLSAHGSVGGLKHYGGGLFHIDAGPRRSW